MDHDSSNAPRRPSAALLAVMLLAALATLGACHTADGVGRDVSATGRAVSNTAERLTP